MSIPTDGVLGDSFNAFFTHLSTEEKQEIWGRFLDHHGLTTNPPGTIEIADLADPDTAKVVSDFYSFVGNVYSSEQNQVGNLSVHEVEKRNIMFLVFNLSFKMLQAIQNSIAVTAKNIIFNGKWQEEYTKMLTQVPIYTAEPGHIMKENITNIEDYGFGAVNMQQVAEFMAHEIVEADAEKARIAAEAANPPAGYIRPPDPVVTLEIPTAENKLIYFDRFITDGPTGAWIRLQGQLKPVLTFEYDSATGQSKMYFKLTENPPTDGQSLRYAFEEPGGAGNFYIDVLAQMRTLYPNNPTVFAESVMTFNPNTGITSEDGDNAIQTKRINNWISGFSDFYDQNKSYYQGLPVNGQIPTSDPYAFGLGIKMDSPATILNHYCTQIGNYVYAARVSNIWQMDPTITGPALLANDIGQAYTQRYAEPDFPTKAELIAAGWDEDDAKEEVTRTDKIKTDLQSKRSEINTKLQQYLENIRSLRQTVRDRSKIQESNLTQAREALSQQSSLLTSILEAMKALIASVFR